MRKAIPYILIGVMIFYSIIVASCVTVEVKRTINAEFERLRINVFIGDDKIQEAIRRQQREAIEKAAEGIGQAGESLLPGSGVPGAEEAPVSEPEDGR